MIQDFVSLSFEQAYALLLTLTFVAGMATMYILVWFYYGESTGTEPEAERR